ncbi:MAG: alpha/beta fold hydrolase [Acidimicrobiia bacterium]|nr:alpha/beta fold hydrolase [Acidimicrobiia bacterium]
MGTSRRLLVTSLLLALVAGSCGGDDGGFAGDPLDEPVAVDIVRNVPYITDAEVFQVWGIDDDRTLTMQRFVPDGDGPWPIVVILHGRQHDSDMVAPLAEAIAERGAITYAPDYLYDDPARSFEQIESGLWMGEKTIPDLTCVVAAARADAVSHGGDPDHVVLVGHSFGGMVGATVALVGDDPGIQLGASGTCVVSGASSSPKAFVGLDAVYDWAALAGSRDFEFFAEAEDAHRAVSPLSHVDPASEVSPEFHLLSSDLSIPMQAGGHTFDGFMGTFEAALREAGYAVSTTINPGQSHSAYIQPRAMPEVVDLIIELAYD